MINNNTLNNLLFNETALKILLELDSSEEIYTAVINKKIGCTFAHASYVIKFLQDKNILTFEKYNRTKLLILTDEGKQVIKLLKDLQIIFNRLN